MIICAAIRIKFNRNEKPIHAVIPGRRHCDCHDLMAALSVPLQRQEEDGFITHTGAFLDRYDAYDHAISCGQLPATVCEYKESKGERQLYSEDLY